MTGSLSHEMFLPLSLALSLSLSLALSLSLLLSLSLSTRLTMSQSSLNSELNQILIRHPYMKFHLGVIQTFYRKLNPEIGVEVCPESRQRVATLSLTIPLYYGSQVEPLPVFITIFIPNEYPFKPLTVYITSISDLIIRPSNGNEISRFGRINIHCPTSDRNPGMTVNHDLIDLVKNIVPYLQHTPLVYHRNMRDKRTKCGKIHQPLASCQKLYFRTSDF